MKELEQILERMEPLEALANLAPVIKNILAHIDEESRGRFVAEIIDVTGEDKIASMVSLWLAECMDEGVDPTDMCQSLVSKVAQSKQLMSVTDPGILVLFEAWLDELEEEVVSYMKGNPNTGPMDLAENLGLSKSGASFLVAKLQREEKIW